MADRESGGRDLARTLDCLIDRYAAILEAQPDDTVKIGDFLKLVEVRNKLHPDDTTQAKFWSHLETVRNNELARPPRKEPSASKRHKPKPKKKVKS